MPMPDHSPPTPRCFTTSAAAAIGPSFVLARACWIVLMVSRGCNTNLAMAVAAALAIEFLMPSGKNASFCTRVNFAGAF